MPYFSESSKYFRKAISSVQGRFCANFNSEMSNPLLSSRQPSHASGCPSMSRSFEQFKVASVWTSWQHVRMLFRVQEDSISPLQTRIRKTACTHSDARAAPSERRDPLIRKLYAYILHPSGQQGNIVRTWSLFW
jgi:hypothetical protein